MHIFLWCRNDITGLLFIMYDCRYGRRRVIISMAFMQVVVGFSAAFSPNFVAFVIFRFLTGMSRLALSTTLFISCKCLKITFCYLFLHLCLLQHTGITLFSLRLRDLLYNMVVRRPPTNDWILEGKKFSFTRYCIFNLALTGKIFKFQS